LARRLAAEETAVAIKPQIVFNVHETKSRHTVKRDG
jgi:hypothetical protein